MAMPGIDAFFDPEPRLELMKEMGIDRTLLWPTLASVLEERLADDPDGGVRGGPRPQQWMHEHWSFVYSDAIFSTPIISLRGARPGARGARVRARAGRQDLPHPGGPGADVEGRKSFALPEFDPFWERVQELDLVVGMHSGDSRLHTATSTSGRASATSR